MEHREEKQVSQDDCDVIMCIMVLTFYFFLIRYTFFSQNNYENIFCLRSIHIISFDLIDLRCRDLFSCIGKLQTSNAIKMMTCLILEKNYYRSIIHFVFHSTVMHSQQMFLALLLCKC